MLFIFLFLLVSLYSALITVIAITTILMIISRAAGIDLFRLLRGLLLSCRRLAQQQLGIAVLGIQPSVSVESNSNMRGLNTYLYYLGRSLLS